MQIKEETSCSENTQPQHKAKDRTDGNNPNDERTVRKGRTMTRHKKERDLTMLCLSMVVMFCICWLPYVIVMLLELYQVKGVPDSVQQFVLICGYANSLLNPIVYGYKNKRLRKVYQEMIYCKLKSNK